MHYWKSGPLPNDQEALAAITKLDVAAWKGVWAKLSAFFTVNGDGTLHQKRMDKEREHWTGLSEKRRDAGRSAVRRPSTGRTLAKGSAPPTALPPETTRGCAAPPNPTSLFTSAKLWQLPPICQWITWQLPPICHSCFCHHILPSGSWQLPGFCHPLCHQFCQRTCAQVRKKITYFLFSQKTSPRAEAKPGETEQDLPREPDHLRDDPARKPTASRGWT